MPSSQSDREKHDAGCRRRKVEMNFPYLCTCDMTDLEVVTVKERVKQRQLDVLSRLGQELDPEGYR